MMAWGQVSSSTFDFQSWAGPGPTRWKITEEGQEPTPARKLGVKEVGSRLCRGNNTWCEVFRAL